MLQVALFATVAVVALRVWRRRPSGAQAVAGRLERERRRLPAIARRRVRVLGFGAALAAFAILAALIAGAAGHPAIELGLQVVSVAAALFLLLGLAPPAALRMAWRRQEESTLSKAELEVMRATTPSEVAAPIVEPVARMLGGDGALLVDADGRVIAVHGLDAEAAAETARRVAAKDGTEPPFDGEVLAVPLRGGWLAVQASQWAPSVGSDEIALVQRVGRVIDVGLERSESLANDRATRAVVEQAHTEMESLLYTVSHDLKSPLLTVLGYIDLLRAEGIVLDGRAGHSMERIEASALYMQHLINDLLELSRIGRHEVRSEDVDLAALVADVAEELSSRSPSAYVGIGLLPVVTTSPARARQLVTNLLDNAVLHGGRSDVAIEVGSQRRPDGGARLWVADNGRGVAPEHREKAFGVFERFDDRPPGDSGTGIGLAACRKIVEHLGGTMYLADVERGTRVEIMLPAAVVRWQPATAGVAARP
jgi:signal transduction histidine kinase